MDLGTRVRGPGASRTAGTGWLGVAVAVPAAWWTISLLATGNRWIFPDYVNLAFHEAGHIFFRVGGSTLMYLGGTLGQLLVPLLLGARFLLKEREPLGAAACLWWTGESLVNVSVYMADARSLALPLVGGGDHDWNEIFYRFGLLSEAAVARISGITRAAGLLLVMGGLAWCACFLLPAGPRLRLKEGLAGRAPWASRLLQRGS